VAQGWWHQAAFHAQDGGNDFEHASSALGVAQVGLGRSHRQGPGARSKDRANRLPLRDVVGLRASAVRVDVADGVRGQTGIIQRRTHRPSHPGTRWVRRGGVIRVGRQAESVQECARADKAAPRLRFGFQNQKSRTLTQSGPVWLAPRGALFPREQAEGVKAREDLGAKYIGAARHHQIRLAPRATSASISASGIGDGAMLSAVERPARPPAQPEVSAAAPNAAPAFSSSRRSISLPPGLGRLMKAIAVPRCRATQTATATGRLLILWRFAVGLLTSCAFRH
jgi:hypothetical protein